MRCIAFEGSARIAEGGLLEVALAAKPAVDRGDWAPVLVFDAETSQVVEIDFRGQPEDLARRLAEPSRGPGRPKLGVVAREVTLLPRHWDWLNCQPGGASVALRKLVEAAKRQNEAKDRLREARESAYRFIRTMAGNEAGFEEATRALFAGNREAFEKQAAAWPTDVREHAVRLAAASW
jgi:hypothetical protein